MFPGPTFERATGAVRPHGPRWQAGLPTTEASCLPHRARRSTLFTQGRFFREVEALKSVNHAIIRLQDAAVENQESSQGDMA